MRKILFSLKIALILFILFFFQFLSAYDRYKKYKISTTKNYAPIRMNLIGQILLYLIPGVVVFIFLPSLIFSYFENWTYSASLYYSFVTLTTIGFGDFVPTFNAEQVRSLRAFQSFDRKLIVSCLISGEKLRHHVSRIRSIHYILVYIWSRLSRHDNEFHCKVSLEQIFDEM